MSASSVDDLREYLTQNHPEFEFALFDPSLSFFGDCDQILRSYRLPHETESAVAVSLSKLRPAPSEPWPKHRPPPLVGEVWAGKFGFSSRLRKQGAAVQLLIEQNKWTKVLVDDHFRLAKPPVELYQSFYDREWRGSLITELRILGGGPSCKAFSGAGKQQAASPCRSLLSR